MTPPHINRNARKRAFIVLLLLWPVFLLGHAMKVSGDHPQKTKRKEKRQ
jgi:hypothetical protein